MKRVLLALSVLMFAASLVLAWLMVRGGPLRELPPPPVVQAAAVQALFDATLPDAEGRPLALAQWRGRILVVNYWATWCPPCRDEMPAFSELNKRYAARGVQFVGIAIDDAAKVRNFAREYPVSYPLVLAGDADTQISRALGNEAMALPYTLVIDREGQVRTAVLGRVHEDALAKLIDGLI